MCVKQQVLLMELLMNRAVTVLALALSACAASAPAASKPFVATPVATFANPWAMTFLPDGRILVTEKGGTLKLGAKCSSREIA